MARKKLRRFRQLAQLPNVLPGEIPHQGRWEDYFGNRHPLVLELACGKGEYSCALAALHPERNFVGVDIKGERLWKAAVTAREKGLRNVLFLRDRVEELERHFKGNEISEIWLPFPDPFPRRRHHKRRLTAPSFLSLYRRLLQPGGRVHLKTDDPALFDYTRRNLTMQPVRVHHFTENLYGSLLPRQYPDLAIQTTFEKRHLQARKFIKYLCFSWMDEGELCPSQEGAKGVTTPVKTSRRGPGGAEKDTVPITFHPSPSSPTPSIDASEPPKLNQFQC